MSLYHKEPKEKKEFKIHLGRDDSEKVLIPIYGDEDPDEILLILVKEFELLIKDGNLFKENEIGNKATGSFTATNKTKKLKAVKEVYRKFRSCLKGKARDTWLTLVEAQPILSGDNYETDNTYGVENFWNNQKKLVKSTLNEEAIEDLKAYLQNTKKPRKFFPDYA